MKNRPFEYSNVISCQPHFSSSFLPCAGMLVVVDADGAVRQAQLLAVRQRLLRADAQPPQPNIALTGHRQEGGKIIQSSIVATCQ